MQLEPGALAVSRFHSNIFYYVVLDIIEDDVFLYDIREAKTTWSSVEYIKNYFQFL